MDDTNATTTVSKRSEIGRLQREHPRLHNTWRSMKKRCYYKAHDSYQYYGARGITVCDEWRGNFEAFHSWAMANGYEDGLTIDRINNDGNYEPGNCQWMTMAEQNRKHKHCRLITYKGKTQLAIDWAREYGIKLPTFYWRLYHGYSIEEVLSTPVRGHVEEPPGIKELKVLHGDVVRT